MELRINELIAESGKTVYGIAKDGEMSANTIYSMLSKAEKKELVGINLSTLNQLLIGLGYSKQQIRELKLSDIFEIRETA